MNKRGAYFKRAVLLGLVVVAAIGILTACLSGNNRYSRNELNAIKIANRLVSEQYGAKVEQKDFAYTVGKQLENRRIAEYSSTEKEDLGIISVSAMRKSGEKPGQVNSFRLLYNTRGWKLLSIEADLQK